MEDIFTGGALRAVDIPKPVYRLAMKLQARHGRVTVLLENKGHQLYIACPKCLQVEGKCELEKKHFSVNADMAEGLGKFAGARGTYNADRGASCMKCGFATLLSRLLDMPPLSMRGYPDAPMDHLLVLVRQRYLVDDGRGNMIPEGPGFVTPINKLPSNHHAVQYLLGRGYDLDSLWAQFQCSYCHAETPERYLGKDNPASLAYAPLPGGFKDTPQGRIIFYAFVEGVQIGWQGRILDKVEGPPGAQIKSYWHPYEMRWVQVEMLLGNDAKGKPIKILMDPFNTQPPYDWKNPRWDPSKYKTGRGVIRNELVMGLDAAVEWNKRTRPGKPPIVCGSEGPLDAGKIGPPGVAIIGKHISEAQAGVLSTKFRQMLWFGDDDVAGRQATAKVKTILGGKMTVHEMQLPDGCKDLGEVSAEIACRMIQPFL